MKKLFFTIITSIIGFTASAFQFGDKLLLSAKLTGDQEVPAVVTNAIGVASFLFSENHDSLCVNVTVTGLSGAITQAHIHTGDVGVSGPVLKDLTTNVSGTTIKAVITGADLSTHLQDYLSGKLYLNVHTDANPDGEIRGQIYLETDWSYVTTINASQVVPLSTSLGYGLGIFNLSKDSSTLKYNVVIQGLNEAITEVHLNYGTIGKNGGVAADLTPSLNNGFNVIGDIDNPSAALIDSLTHGKVYIDFSTATHPIGTELRGQLMNQSKYLYFDAYLNGLQEVPVINTPAFAVASVMLSAAYDTVFYDVVSNGLTGPITAAHFHAGAPGASGSAVIDILPGLAENRITGKIYGSALTADFIKKLITGNLYINLHTAINPDGEIRGQVYRLARQGYTLNLNGVQETPPVTTNAKGSGIVSIDREGGNAHFMIVTDGLTPDAAHFHKQIAGQSGGVMFDLFPYHVNGGTFGYWKSDNAVPFTLAVANAFDSDSVYANFHTPANPNGEIRGQAIKYGECYNDVSTGITDEITSIEGGLLLYPNPVEDLLNISFKSDVQFTARLEIVDVLGKQIYADNFSAQAGNNLRSVFVNKFKNGIYFVRLQTDKGQTIQRFVKN